MAHFFRSVPDFEYISRFQDAKISEYVRVKNIFTNVKIKDEIFQNLVYFTKYTIIGDERPDNIAQKYYEDSTLDWLVLLSNNIVNFYEEWPLPQQSYDQFLLDKYGSYDKINDIHHYETKEVLNSKGIKIVEKGLSAPSDFSVTFYDSGSDREVTKTNIVTPITNREYEDKLQTERRTIYLIKKEYAGLVIDDIKNVLEYKKGSTQFVSRTLKKADNIRLFQ